MDWNARFQQGRALWDNGEYDDASEIFEEVAEGTMDPIAINAVIAAKVMLANADMGMVNSGMPVSPESLVEVNKALKWIEVAERNASMMSDSGQQINANHRTCSAIKGKLLYLLRDANCEGPLIDAIKRGDNQSRVPLALLYKDIAGELVDQGDASKVGLIREYYNRMTRVFEDYISNYNPKEAESDEFRMACTIVAKEYEAGMTVEPDMNKVRMYRTLAANFDEATKTSRY